MYTRTKVRATHELNSRHTINKEVGGSSIVERHITREELKAKMDRGDDLVVVDALSEQHYEGSHPPDALDLPLEYVDEAERVLPDKSAETIV